MQKSFEEFPQEDSAKNQEDSLGFNRSAAERGEFRGVAFSFIKTELEKNERFGNPDESNTIIEKKYANYSKIQGGVVKKGTILNKGDIVIGKMVGLSKPVDHKIYRDTSIEYPYNEPAMVERVVLARNQEGEEFCKVKFSSVRTLGIGDKFCRLPTAQILTDQGWVEIQDINYNHKIACLIDGKNLEYHRPSGIYRFYHDGPMYYLNDNGINIQCTLNHKLYVRTDTDAEYKLYSASDVQKKNITFKRDCLLGNKDIEDYICLSGHNNIADISVKMDDWIQFLAIFLLRGSFENIESNIEIQLESAKSDHIEKLCRLMLLPFTFDEKGYHIRSYVVSRSLQIIGNKSAIGSLPTFIWNLSQRQSKLFLDTLLKYGSVKNCGDSMKFYHSSPAFLNDLTKIAFHAGYTTFLGKQMSRHNPYFMEIIVNNINPQINSAERSAIIHYEGYVYCLEVPSHVLYTRETPSSIPIWDGNSSRAG